jgi:cyclic pyranopterin phosphate synthase
LIEITEKGFSVEEVINSVRKPNAGALVVFIGTVRAEPGIDGLELESYKEMAQEKMNEIRNQTMERFSILEVSIIHRIGKIGIGENIITIAVSAAHRADAFLACRFLIDELKVTTPIWKKELGPGTWVSGEVPTDLESKATTEKLSGMVDISDKEIVQREAVAEGVIELSRSTLEAIKTKNIKKGDVFEAAKLTAVNGVKQTPNLIPLCHPIPITSVDVNFEILNTGIKARCKVRADYKTGVEMEALTGVNVALLTIWDMVKYLEKDDAGQYPTTRIHDIIVVHKTKMKEK